MKILAFILLLEIFAIPSLYLVLLDQIYPDVEEEEQ